MTKTKYTIRAGNVLDTSAAVLAMFGKLCANKICGTSRSANEAAPLRIRGWQ